MMDDVVEEVGEYNVIHIVTDNSENYKAVGDLLMQKRKKKLLDTMRNTLH